MYYDHDAACGPMDAMDDETEAAEAAAEGRAVSVTIDPRHDKDAADLLEALVPVVRSRALSLDDAWAVVAAVVPLVRAETLRDAADDLALLVDDQHPDALNPDQWLADRADRIERGFTS